MPLLIIRGSGRYRGDEEFELSFGEYCVLYRSQNEGGDGSVLVTHPVHGPFALVTVQPGCEESLFAGGRRWAQPNADEELVLWIDEVLIEQPLPVRRVVSGGESSTSIATRGAADPRRT